MKDFRAKIIDKYTVYVVDIEEAKKTELFRLNQNVSALKNSDEESEEYKHIKNIYNSSVQELEQMSHFIESEMPQVGDFEVAVPYYEETKGDILQKWEILQNNVYLISKKIEALKQKLADSDYKIIKSYESNLLGMPAPYNIEELHVEREKIRDEINELEKLLL